MNNTIDITRLTALVDAGLLTMRKHPTSDLLIWNYTAKAQYERAWTEELLMCRGLITDTAGTIISRPFPKFFNLEEHLGRGDALPAEPFTVTKKYDGSLGITYFVEEVSATGLLTVKNIWHNGRRVALRPNIATRGSFESEQAIRANEILREKYGHVGAEFWDARFTYLFEIIYPENRIVADYGAMEDLVLLAVIHTASGYELDIHDREYQHACPFPISTQYDGITDLEELAEIAKGTRFDDEEGFVVRFASGLRLKVKYAEYVRLHRLLTGVNERTVWELLRTGQGVDALLDKVPDEYYVWVKEVAKRLVMKYHAVFKEAHELFRSVRDLPTRKEQALAITPSPNYAAIVFRMLDGKEYESLIWKAVKPEAGSTFKVVKSEAE